METEATAALVSLVMKLSEAELRPLFLHLCEWKAGVSGDGPQAMLGLLDRRLSFYRVLDGLAAALKVTIFSLFCFCFVRGVQCRLLLQASNRL